MSRNRRPDPTLFVITRLDSTPELAPVAGGRGPQMSPWRKAVIAATLAAAPTPVIATIVNGSAGWTGCILIAAPVVLVATVVSHAHSETAVRRRPETAPIETSWVDSYGNHIHYQARPGRTEAA